MTPRIAKLERKETIAIIAAIIFLATLRTVDFISMDVLVLFGLVLLGIDIGVSCQYDGNVKRTEA